MPVFRYEGYNADGSKTSGTLEADGLQAAVLEVKGLGVYPKKVSEYVHGEGRGFKRSDAALLPYVTRQLATLLSSGVPLMEALKSLSDQSHGGWAAVLADLRERVAGGEDLARALDAHAKVFPRFYVSLVSAGLESGALEKVLLRLADFLEQEASIRSKVRSSMVYPLFMVTVSFFVMAFLFTFVIPKIVRIFESSKSALPIMTVVLIAISNFFVNYWWLLGILVAGGVYALRRMREKHRLALDRFKLRLPGGVLQSLYYTRFTRSLSFLLEGGVPMLRALELSARSIGNLVLEGVVSSASKRVGEGARLSQSLEGFPPVLLQLIATGERSGKLPEVLGRAADSYEDDFGRRVDRALSLLEPSMILLMGLVVLFIVVAVLLPMFQLNQLIK